MNFCKYLKIVIFHLFIQIFTNIFFSNHRTVFNEFITKLKKILTKLWKKKHIPRQKNCFYTAGILQTMT